MALVSRNWRPLLFIVLGLAAVVSAHYLLDTCGDHGTMVKLASGGEAHMRCHWSERAFQGLGALVAFGGVAMLFFRDAVRGIALAVAGAGVLMIVNTLWLVPTCAMPNMVCNLSFKPGALLFGGVTMLAGFIGTLQFRRLDAMGGERHAV